MITGAYLAAEAPAFSPTINSERLRAGPKLPRSAA